MTDRADPAADPPGNPASIPAPKPKAEKADIQIIEGDSSILLIAPHACIRDGKTKNDENTGPITELAAKQLGCSAIINTLFHKSKQNHKFFEEWRSQDDSNVMVYDQKRTVAYADYKVGLFYISPDDLVCDGKTVMRQSQEK